MKWIEDEEVRPAFDKAWDEYCSSTDPTLTYTSQSDAEYFFQAGRDSLAKEFWTARPKRIIEKLIKTDQGWFALSNTGEWFYFNRPLDSEPYWIKYPDLPQEG